MIGEFKVGEESHIITSLLQELECKYGVVIELSDMMNFVMYLKVEGNYDDITKLMVDASARTEEIDNPTPLFIESIESEEESKKS